MHYAKKKIKKNTFSPRLRVRWHKVNEETDSYKFLPLRNYVRVLEGLEELMALPKRYRVHPGGGGQKASPSKDPGVAQLALSPAGGRDCALCSPLALKQEAICRQPLRLCQAHRAPSLTHMFSLSLQSCFLSSFSEETPE